MLRARRAALLPEDFGLSPGRRRHVSGLRREEVAQLAEVSLDWYVRLEQGRIEVISPSALRRVVDCLRFPAAERDLVFSLARERNASMATIEEGSEIFTLINTFTVDPGMQRAVIDSLRDVTEKVMRHLPGFVAASVHASVDGTHVANYVQWRTKADFDAMFADPRAQAHMAEVGALAIAVMPIVYRVVYVGQVGS